MKCMVHGNFTIIIFWKQKPLWLFGLFTIICKGSDDEVVTEQLTALVDVTFMLHTIIWLILWMVTQSINQRHCDQAMYQIMFSPCISQTLGSPIL